MQLATRIAAFSLLASGASAQFTVEPGTLLGLDASTPGGLSFTLIKYSHSGVVLDSLVLNPTDPLFNAMDGVTAVGNEVFGIGLGGILCRFDLTSGASTTCWPAAVIGPEALGNLGGELLVGDFSANQVQRWTTDGVFVGTIQLATDRELTGLDSNGQTLFVGSFTDGNVYTYDLNGNETGVIPTGIGPDSISGLSYDASSNSLWVSTGYGSDEVIQFSLSGSVIGGFTPAAIWINGLSAVDCNIGASSETVRLGAPANPDALRPGQTFSPFLGAQYDPIIDHAAFAPGSVLDVLAVAFNSVNVPSPLGTILCDPTSATVVTTTPGSAFLLPIPSSCSLVGLQACCQGASVEASGAIALTNALDLVVGGF